MKVVSGAPPSPAIARQRVFILYQIANTCYSDKSHLCEESAEMHSLTSTQDFAQLLHLVFGRFKETLFQLYETVIGDIRTECNPTIVGNG